MPGEAFRRVFWDIITEVSAPSVTRAWPGGVLVSNSGVAVVIEDDTDIRVLISQVLEQAGFVVHAASSGMDGIELVREHQPVVTTLDVSMPGIDGFETAKRIREVSDTYIVMLTARADEIDTLQGLQAGADDYVTKPFRPRELRARIEAMMRRPRTAAPATVTPIESAPSAVAAAAAANSTPTAASQQDESDGWYEHRGLRLHPEMRIAMVDGADVELTRSEFDIMADLLSAGRRVVGKDDLALMLRGERYAGGSGFVSEHDVRAIEVHVANLRRKLGESAAKPRWIETIRGVGYRLTSA
ncbi:MAG: response regulator transcription factor [Microbacterium sp.]|mgnify:CR=1 FL=1|nr:response regulator transcription factor [Microbacterium sp.]|tara:strand:+ start:457 stop:1356 length:900 start_codon:yes stop_codon:yes gene_type:complete